MALTDHAQKPGPDGIRSRRVVPEPDDTEAHVGRRRPGIAPEEPVGPDGIRQRRLEEPDAEV